MEHVFARVANNTRYEIIANALLCGDDINVTICGGTKHHIGAVALCTKNQDIKMIKQEGHKDDVVARIIGENLINNFEGNICVSVGIHIDDATYDEIQTLIENSKKAAMMLTDEIKKVKKQ